MMRIESSYTSSAPADELWAALSDPERLGEALPGVTYVDVESPERFSATVRPATTVGITPLDLTVEVREREEGRRVRLVGDGAGGEHRVTFDVTLSLAPAPAGCEVTWAAGVQAFGVLASLTQRILPAILRDQVTLVLRTAEEQSASTTTE
ncbi:MAG TPA: SRPBCC family protein [Capillimicrobium sp.]|jgi:carbon monoxide dehydrogenase subunit G